jgi:FkbM family methyltransferase
MGTVKELIRQTLNKFRIDLVAYPPSDWTRARNILQEILRRKEINCVIDAGANEGQFGQELRMFGYQGRIVSFEPVRKTFEILDRVRKENPGEWLARNKALASSSGSAEINVCEGSDFSSFLTPLEGSIDRFPSIRVERTERVEMVRLDEVFDECIQEIDQPRVFLKMDTQGYNLEVIRGAARVIHQISALQAEVSFKPIYATMSTFEDTLPALLELGFDVFDFIPVSRDSRGLGIIEMDCVMTR